MANYHLVQQRGSLCNFPHQSEMYSKGGRCFGVHGELGMQMAKQSGAKTTPCRHGDLGMQTVTSIYTVWSRFRIGGDLGNYGRDLGGRILTNWRVEKVATRLPSSLPLIWVGFRPTIGLGRSFSGRSRVWSQRLWLLLVRHEEEGEQLRCI